MDRLELYDEDGPNFRRRSPLPPRRLFRTIAVIGLIAIIGLTIDIFGLMAVHFFVSCSVHSSLQPVPLTMSYDPETQAWIEDVVKDFNQRRMTACDGPITVQATPMGSAQLMQNLLSGTARPDIWSPVSRDWLTRLNSGWQAKHHGQQLVGTGNTDSPSLLRSPIVIAMWKPEAQALGWPNKALGWSDIAKLSANPNGWSAYGHPEFGAFKFAHTHPNYSDSGLETLIAMNYASKNKQDGLTLNDVNSAPNKNFVSTIESSVIYYGDSPSFSADKMFTNGPGYLSAVALNENLLFQMNDGKTYPHLASPVVAIYPKEGTFSNDYPYAVLNASWVTPTKKSSAQAFSKFLLAADQQKKAFDYGFRSSDPSVLSTTSLDTARGLNFKQSSPVLSLPNPAVVSAIQSEWVTERPHIDVMILLDNSGTMGASIGHTTKKGGSTKIESAKSGLKEFVNLFSVNDNLGFTIFRDQATVESPVDRLGPKQLSMLDTISKVTAPPLGWTRLFDTIAEQQKALQSMPARDIKALVVLTDGKDNSSDLKLDQLDKLINLTGKDAGSGVKIFTIAYGDDADQAALKDIANAGGGQEYTSNLEDIQALYAEIGRLLGSN